MPSKPGGLRRFAAACLFLSLLGCATPPETESDPETLVGPRNVIALLPHAQILADMRQAAQSGGYRELDATGLPGLGLTMLTFRMPPGITGPEAIIALENAVPGATVGVNHGYRLQQQARASSELDYADAMMRWREGGCPARVRIGLIDTGVDTSAAVLDGAQIVTRSFFEGRALPAQHGTDVAAILAGPDRLQDARIYAANVFGQRDAEGPLAGADALVRALDWMAEEQVRVVNLALAGPFNKLLDLAVDRATARGLILVAAVGNDGPVVDPLYPAGFERVIAVTAVDAEARIYNKAVRGPHVDVAAPGVDVLVRSDRGARFVTGTSIATPFVTARLAADPIIAKAPSVAEVRQRLAVTSEELGPEGHDEMFGYGLAQAPGICGE